MSPLALIFFAWALVVVHVSSAAGLALALVATLIEFMRLGGMGLDE